MIKIMFNFLSFYFTKNDNAIKLGRWGQTLVINDKRKDKIINFYLNASNDHNF